MADQKPIGSRPYSFTPGKEIKGARPRDAVPEERVAWFYSYSVLVDLLMLMPEEGIEGQATLTPDILLTLSRPRAMSQKIILGLSSFTEEELTQLKSIIDFAFDQALPVVQKRDQYGRAVFETDGEPLKRSFRSAPSVSIRTGKIEKHLTRIKERFGFVPRVVRLDGDSDGSGGGELPSAGGTVAGGDAADVVTLDSGEASV